MSLDNNPFGNSTGFGDSFDGNSTDEPSELSGGITFVIFWIIGMIMFVCLPFISTDRRRMICAKRMRERRWNVEVPPDPLQVRHLPADVARRRERAQRRREQFELSKTQQDEIRQQFLKSCMDEYTMQLAETDIHEVEDKDDRSTHSGRSFRSFFTRNNSNRSLTPRRRSSIRSNKSDNDSERGLSSPTRATNPGQLQRTSSNLTTALTNATNDSSSSRGERSDSQRRDTGSHIEHVHVDNDRARDVDTSHENNNNSSSNNNNNDDDDDYNDLPIQRDLEVPLGHDGTDVVVPIKVEDTPATSTENPRQGRSRADSMDSCDSILESDFADAVDDVNEDANETLYIPLPGQKRPKPPAESNDDNTEKPIAATSAKAYSAVSPRRRNVPNGCAICIAPLEAGDSVTWSSNPHCSHIFHDSCILHWLLTVGRKTARKRMRARQQNDDTVVEDDLDKICQFPMECPCCRQDFIILPDDDQKDAEQAKV